MQLDHFMARRVAADQFDAASGAIQSFGQKPQEGLIGGGVNGRGSHLDTQLVSNRFADFVGRSARLQLDGQE